MSMCVLFIYPRRALSHKVPEIPSWDVMKWAVSFFPLPRPCESHRAWDHKDCSQWQPAQGKHRHAVRLYPHPVSSWEPDTSDRPARYAGGRHARNAGEPGRTSATSELSSVHSRPVRMEAPGAMTAMNADWNSLFP